MIMIGRRQTFFCHFSVSYNYYGIVGTACSFIAVSVEKKRKVKRRKKFSVVGMNAGLI